MAHYAAPGGEETSGFPKNKNPTRGQAAKTICQNRGFGVASQSSNRWDDGSGRHSGPTTKEMSENTINIKDYQKHEGDTGSSPVQIALLTKRILELTEHMGRNRKDFSSRRGLLMLVSNRRRLLDYLKRTDEPEYQRVIKGLGLRR